jgi:hypothetical protein
MTTPCVCLYGRWKYALITHPAYSTNTYSYVDIGTTCKTQNNKGYEFINWVRSPLTNRNSSISLEPSSIDPKNLTVDRYGIFTANFKQLTPLSNEQVFNYLTGVIATAVAINGAILTVSVS